MKFLVLLIVLVVVACTSPAPKTTDIATGLTTESTVPNSESNYAYAGGITLPVDTRIYDIVGTVIAEVDSLTRQTKSAYGSVSGYSSGSFGSVSGVYVGPTINGKSFIRIQVESIVPADTDWVTKGDVIIIKGTDTKLTSALPGDNIEVLCRREAETIGAVKPGEWVDESYVTWELDLCRLKSPVIKVK